MLFFVTPRLVIIPDQGLGDEILYARLFNSLSKKVEHCSVICDPRLYSIYQRSFSNLNFISNDVNMSALKLSDISVDNTCLFLAAALGVPTIGLLHKVPHFIWQYRVIHHPWFESLIVYRQQYFDDWSIVIEMLYSDLNKRLQNSIKVA